jgi:hypothetical protein
VAVPRITNSVNWLDDSQRQAIVHTLSHLFASMDGPPGTGTSTYIAELPDALSGDRVLITSHSIIACNRLARLLMAAVKGQGLTLVCVVGEVYRPDLFACDRPSRG